MCCSVPDYFNIIEKKAIFDAALIANMNIIKLIEEHIAIAMMYMKF